MEELRALPVPVGNIPTGVLIAVAQSPRAIMPLTTYRANMTRVADTTLGGTSYKSPSPEAMTMPSIVESG